MEKGINIDERASPIVEGDEKNDVLLQCDHAGSARLSAADAYTAAFQMLCKYADMSTAVRNGVFIQGVVVLSGILLLMSDGKYFFAMIGCIFLIAFTAILAFMHDHYNKYFFSVREYIRHLENKHGSDGVRGYVDFVENERDLRVDGSYVGWLRMHGPFVLIVAAASILFVHTLLFDTCGGVELFGVCIEAGNQVTSDPSTDTTASTKPLVEPSKDGN